LSQCVHLAVLCAGLPLLPACARAQPSAPVPSVPPGGGPLLQITRVHTDRDQVPRFGRVQFSIGLRGRFANPFDPDEIALEGRVTTPSGRQFVMPGFYTQGFVRRLADNREKLVPRGTPGWRLRVCATEVGKYRVAIVARDRAGREVSTPPVRFTAIPSPHPGFVRRSRLSPRYFAFDSGAAYVPIGANVCWGGGPGTFDYDRWFARYSAVGANYGRLWLGPTWTTFGIDRQGLGKIDLENAWRLDYVLNLAEKSDLYLMLCLDSYNELRYAKDGASPFWEQTPHNAANGGPLRQPGEFWTSQPMDRLYRNRLRYLVARYGASPHMLAWEFWNEVDIVSSAAWDEEKVRAWHQRMGRYLRGLDPYHHLITTSFSGSAGKSAIDRLPELDYVQTHSYGAHDIVAEIQKRQGEKAGYGKPHYVGECGIGEHDERDRSGVYLHNALWGGFFAGSAGTGMLWWWDNHIDPNNLYPQFAPLSAFLRGVDPPRLRLQPTSRVRLAYVTAPRAPVVSDLELPAEERSWSACPANRPTGVWISGEGAVRVDAALSGLLHGQKNHPDLHNPVTFHLDLRRPTELVVQVSGVSGYGGGHLVARRNGDVVLDKPMVDQDGNTGTDTLHQYDGAYTVAIPAGPQTVEIDNCGIDWMYVGYLLKDGRATVKPPLRVMALTGVDAALAWVQNPENEWYRTLVQKQTPHPVAPTVMELTGLREGRYQVTLWDTYQGRAERQLLLRPRAGVLTVPLPEVTKDLAVKAVRVG